MLHPQTGFECALRRGAPLPSSGESDIGTEASDEAKARGSNSSRGRRSLGADLEDFRDAIGIGGAV